jgi:hypothetical protein
VFVLSNRNIITCSTCFSKLQVENKNVSGRIGGVGGGVGAALIMLLLFSFHMTGNLVYLGMIVPLFLLLLAVVFLLVDKYVKVKVVEAVHS